jgi:hypothetical protein
VPAGVHMRLSAWLGSPWQRVRPPTCLAASPHMYRRRCMSKSMALHLRSHQYSTGVLACGVGAAAAPCCSPCCSATPCLSLAPLVHACALLVAWPLLFDVCGAGLLANRLY